MMNHIWKLIAAVAGVAGWGWPALAESLSATVTGVEGIVQVRMGEEGPWQPVKVGMVLGEGAEFRTGPRSAVRFVIPPDQTVTLDRLGVVKLIEAARSEAKVKTDLGMKYGRVRYDIEAAGVDHESTIHSPGSALAVRGTKVSLYDQPPFAPQAVSLTGRAQFRNARKQAVAFGGKGKGKAAVSSDQSSAAQNAAVASTLDSPALQYTEQRLRELEVLFRNQGQVLGNVGFSTKRVSDVELPSLLSGNLDFVLRWSTPGKQTADLNLFVRTPLGENMANPPFILSLYPNNPKVGELLRNGVQTSTPSGGQIGLNHIGPEGIEIATFGASFPKGVYTVGTYNFLPPDENFKGNAGPKVPFTLEAFQNGKRLPVLLNLEEFAAGEEEPRFGFVFKDKVQIGEISATAVRVEGAGGRGKGGRLKEVRSPKPEGRKTRAGAGIAKPAGK